MISIWKRKTKAKTAEPPLSDVAISWLLAAQGLTLAPQVLRLPWWLTGLFITAALWRWGVSAKNWRLPSRWLLPVPTLIAVAAIIAQYGTPFGRDPGTALLAAMAAMKLLEARTTRDGMVLIVLGFLQLLAGLLYEQGLSMAAYATAVIPVLLTAQLTIYHQHRHVTQLVALKISARLVLQALPLMLIFFLLFPRINGPLWSLPEDAHSGLSGLADEMSPGSISELILSDAIVFRVQFDGKVPPPEQQYWRGPVLSRYWNRTWRGREEVLSRDIPYTPLADPIDYSVTLEANGRHWLFALELPGSLPPRAGISASYQLKRREPINDRLRYQVRSYLQYRTGPLTVQEHEEYLRLPRNTDPHAHELAKSWQQQYHRPEAIANAALRYFREQEFFYTLQPPLLGQNNVDEFLFSSRRGFCEHYAGSFAFLMRAAGIPTRVVLGYQGGEHNGNYFIVRQSDAHAWTEIWLAERGWIRVDPTAAVAPERIEKGIYAAISDPQRLPFFARRDATWLRQLGLTWDRVNSAWIDWVLAYGPERQRDFLSRLGFGSIDWTQMTIAMVALACLLPLLAIGWIALRRYLQVDPVVRSYQLFCRKLARQGLVRADHEGPLAFSQRAAETFPHVAEQCRDISQRYAQLHYGNKPTANKPNMLQRKQLQQRINKLKI